MRVSKQFGMVVGATLAISCAAAVDPDAATSAMAMLTSQCVGQIQSGEVRVVRPGEGVESIQLPWAVGLELGKLSRDGQTVIGWNRSGIRIIRGREVQTLSDILVDSPFLDLSADGSRVVVSGKHSPTNLSGLLLLDRDGVLLERVSENGSSPAMSPDGETIAFEEGDSIRFHGKGQVLLPGGKVEGRMASWAPSGQLGFLRDSEYRIVELPSQKTRSIPVRGTPLTPLQWSSNGLAAMYVTRTISDYWSPLSCTERYQVVVSDTRDGRDFVYHVGCSSYPERIQWLGGSACRQP